MSWTPTVEEACGEMPENFLTLFVRWLRKPEQKQPSSTPQVIAVALLLQALIAKKRTLFQILCANLIYGLSRSRELVDNSRMCSIDISYQEYKELVSNLGLI